MCHQDLPRLLIPFRSQTTKFWCIPCLRTCLSFGIMTQSIPELPNPMPQKVNISDPPRFLAQHLEVISGNLTQLLNMAIYSEFSHKKCDFPQLCKRLPEGIDPYGDQTLLLSAKELQQLCTEASKHRFVITSCDHNFFLIIPKLLTCYNQIPIIAVYLLTYPVT